MKAKPDFYVDIEFDIFLGTVAPLVRKNKSALSVRPYIFQKIFHLGHKSKPSMK